MSATPTISGQTYKATRPRGFATWRPQRKTLVLLAAIKDVLDEYAAYLPLAARQIFYRLVGAHGFPKSESDYARMLDVLSRARRAGHIEFDAIRDDGVVENLPRGFDGPSEFWEAVRNEAGLYRRQYRDGQSCDVEVWAEAAGMVPQLARVAHPFGAAVYSSGGFDSLTVKHNAAQRCVGRDRPTVILHVGDFDASGCSIVDSAAEDVIAFVHDLGGAFEPTFERVAVTPEQIEEFELPSAPPKTTDRRGDWHFQTVQAEALTPVQLANIVEASLRRWTDIDTLDAVLEEERSEREDLVGQVEALEEDAQ